MTRHLLKLVWNRKRTNLLVSLEIFLSFLIVFAVACGAIFFSRSYGRPLGYSIAGVWQVDIDMNQQTDDTWTEEMVNRFAAVLTELNAMEEVEIAAGAQYPPYSLGATNGTWGTGVMIERNEVTDDFAKVVNLEVVRGRWFQSSDDALAYRPVVIDEDMVRAMYGGGDPIGKVFDDAAEPPSRVVGVVTDYRKEGELSNVKNYVFERVKLGSKGNRPPRRVVFRLAPGAGAGFEEKIVKRLRAVAPDWSFEVEPLTASRASMLRIYSLPLLIAGMIATFMILMVALGLSGVMWQNVTQRMRELGLRRAVGGSSGMIARQIVAEIMLIASIGVAVALIVVLQLPLAGLTGVIGIDTYIAAIVTALITIYTLSIACGLYPSWIASRVQPADALRYD